MTNIKKIFIALMLSAFYIVSHAQEKMEVKNYSTMKILATDLGNYLIKATIDGTIDKNSTANYIELGSGLKNKLRSMRGAFNTSCHTEVIYGDAPNVGDGKASSHIFLICNKKRKIGIRLGYDREKMRLRILGYWTSTL